MGFLWLCWNKCSVYAEIHKLRRIYCIIPYAITHLHTHAHNKAYIDASFLCEDTQSTTKRHHSRQSNTENTKTTFGQSVRQAAKQRQTVSIDNSRRVLALQSSLITVTSTSKPSTANIQHPSYKHTYIHT